MNPHFGANKGYISFLYWSFLLAFRACWQHLIEFISRCAVAILCFAYLSRDFFSSPDDDVTQNGTSFRLTPPPPRYIFFIPYLWTGHVLSVLSLTCAMVGASTSGFSKRKWKQVLISLQKIFFRLSFPLTTGMSVNEPSQLTFSFFPFSPSNLKKKVCQGWGIPQ